MNHQSHQVACTANECQPAEKNGAEAVSHRVKPAYRVSRDEHAFSVRVYLPGVAREAVTLSVDNRLLTIEAERGDNVNADWKPVFEERDRSGYLLQLKLSPEVDSANIKASVENGVLTLVLPVAEAAKPRTIEVA